VCAGFLWPWRGLGSTLKGFATERPEVVMSVYRVIDVIGTSSSSWEGAAAEAIHTAAGSVRDLRVAEVAKQDVVVGDDGNLVYRVRLQLSFKYEAGSSSTTRED
jgi:hypothetical protein